MTAPDGDGDVVTFGPDTPSRSTHWLLIGTAASCLVAGFLVGTAINDSTAVEGDAAKEVSAAATRAPTTPTPGRPPLGEDALRINAPFYANGRTTTVVQYEDPFPSKNSHRPPAKTRWVGLEIETCADADMSPRDTFTASALDWELVDAGGTHLGHQRTGSDVFPRMIYPVREVAVQPGHCVQGWVLWALPDGFTATTASYDHEDGRRDGKAEWTLSCGEHERTATQLPT